MHPAIGIRTGTLAVAVAATCLLSTGLAQAAGNGLVAPANALASSRWQPRLEVDSPGSLLRSLGTHWSFAVQASAARLLSDYRLDTPRLGSQALPGGLRLTSGLLLAQRSYVNAFGAGNAADTALAQPYAGIGYSDSSQRGDWGFSADLGLSAQNPGAALQLGRMFSGASLGDTVRELRLQPMVRLGMNYSF